VTEDQTNRDCPCPTLLLLIKLNYKYKKNVIKQGMFMPGGKKPQSLNCEHFLEIGFPIFLGWDQLWKGKQPSFKFFLMID